MDCVGRQAGLFFPFMLQRLQRNDQEIIGSGLLRSLTTQTGVCYQQHEHGPFALYPEGAQLDVPSLMASFGNTGVCKLYPLT